MKVAAPVKIYSTNNDLNAQKISENAKLWNVCIVNNPGNEICCCAIFKTLKFVFNRFR